MSHAVSGRLMVAGAFGSSPGRELKCLFDHEGKIYRPHPYDIPREPHKVAMFSTAMLMAMLDTGLIDDQYLSGRTNDSAELGEHLKHLWNNMERCSGVPMKIQNYP